MIKTFTHWINEAQNFKPLTRDQLKTLVTEEITKQGLQADLNHIDVSQVTDMNVLFLKSKFNGDISKWDVSRVIYMSYMFSESEFNGDISKWNVSRATEMVGMFSNSKFSGDISEWNVRQETDVTYMFRESEFSGDISQWAIPLEKKVVLYSEMKPFQNFETEFLEKLISIAIEKKVPLSGETLNKPPFQLWVTSNKFGL